MAQHKLSLEALQVSNDCVLRIIDTSIYNPQVPVECPILEVICELDVAACDPISETKQKLMDLRLVKMYLEAAKAKVEVCHEPIKGMELYTYAMKLLSKFDCSSCH